MDLSGYHNQEFDDKVRELGLEFFKARESCGEESLRLLHANQRFLKKLEDLKVAKSQVKRSLKGYVDQATIFALRDAELRYQKSCMLDTEKEWADMISNRHEEIKTFRSDLEKHLKQYCDERRKTAAVQAKVTKRTEEDRINALNSVAFCTYAQTIIEGEVRKLCSSATLPTTRNIQRIQNITRKASHSSKNDLKSYYEDRIKEFKRQERILYGRGRDASEVPVKSMLRAGDSANNNSGDPSSTATGTAAANGNNANGGSGNNNANGASDVTAEMLVDTIENRIASKLVATFDNSAGYRTETREDAADINNTPSRVHTSGLNPVPPSSTYLSSSAKMGNVASSGGRRTVAGKASPGLRASALAQHQQHLQQQQQQQQQYSDRVTLTPQRQDYASSGNRRFSLLQNGDLIPAVGIHSEESSTRQKKHRHMGDALTPSLPLASATATEIGGSGGKKKKKKTKLQQQQQQQQAMMSASEKMSKTSPAAVAGQENAAEMSTDTTTTTTKGKKSSKKKKNHHDDDSNVLYDSRRYAAACSSDFVKSHALLDLNAPTIADREEKLMQLAVLSSEARGKMMHLASLRDSLDGLLVRQISCLLAVLHHNVPVALPVTSEGGKMLITATHQAPEALIEQHLLLPPKSATIDFDEILDSSHGPPAHYLLPSSEHSMDEHDDYEDEDYEKNNLYHPNQTNIMSKRAIAQFKKKPLRLSAAQRILQLDCAQKEQDISQLRDRIVLLLQRRPDSPPGTSAAVMRREPL